MNPDELERMYLEVSHLRERDDDDAMQELYERGFIDERQYKQLIAGSIPPSRLLAK